MSTRYQAGASASELTNIQTKQIIISMYETVNIKDAMQVKPNDREPATDGKYFLRTNVIRSMKIRTLSQNGFHPIVYECYIEVQG